MYIFHAAGGRVSMDLYYSSNKIPGVAPFHAMCNITLSTAGMILSRQRCHGVARVVCCHHSWQPFVLPAM